MTDATRRFDAERFSRQTRFSPIGEAGQRRLAAAHVGVAGCGALGSVLADRLVRAGVGRVRLIDRDFVEVSNLPRQALTDEQHVGERLPKAEAVARRLRAIDSAAAIEARIDDLRPHTVRGFLAGLDLVVDGLDNFESRFVLNDACVEAGLPWVYGGVVGASGMWMVVRPGETACLRCWMPTPPPPGALPTCESAGVLGTAPTVVAGLQATEALKCLVGAPVLEGLGVLDLWQGLFRRVPVPREPDCASCADEGAARPHLDARNVSMTTTLCGRNAVQVTPPEGQPTGSLASVERRLAGVESIRDIHYNGYLLRFVVVDGDDDIEVILFEGGRAQIRGTTDEARARTLYARWVGA